MSKMEEENNSTCYHRTDNVLLRKIGGISGSIGHAGLVRSLRLDHNDNNGIRFKIYCKIFSIFGKISHKWEDYYTVDFSKFDFNEKFEQDVE